MMNAVPASVAGVNEIVMAVPRLMERLTNGLAAAAISGVDKFSLVGLRQLPHWLLVLKCS